MTGGRGRVRRLARAKINLDLRVLGRRPDHFHEVRTILQTIEMHDIVTATACRGPLTVRSRASAMPRDRDNLVWTAAAALWRALARSGAPHGAAVTIVKRIPAAAGLGGASSDAAAALQALASLWVPGRTHKVARTVAAAVGSDVPFFFEGGTVLATGRGERLRRLAPLPRRWIVLAVPPFGVSTPDAYRWWDGDRRRSGSGSGRAAPRDWRRRPARRANDLEPPVVARCPAIGEMVERLRAAGAAGAAMTGSGSAVFGLFTTRPAAVAARHRVRRRGWRTWLTQTVSRAECLATSVRFD